MSQNESTTTPPANDRGRTRSPTVQGDEPPSHQPDTLPSASPSQTVAEGPAPGQALSKAPAPPALSPAPEENPDLDTNAEPARLRNGSSSHDAHDTQDEDHDDPEPMALTRVGNSKDALEPLDWDDLEERFEARMRECQAREEELGREFGEWVEVFKAWASVTEIHEEERATKRLRTRITYVQQKENKLEQKRTHFLLSMGMDLDLPVRIQPEPEPEFRHGEEEETEMANRQLRAGEQLQADIIMREPPRGRWGECALM